MRRLLILPFLSGAALLVGCGSSATSYVKSDTTLGRVVVYRNGVAYFERTAKVEGDTLKLTVPGDKVDDFLKSLTVVDAKTGQPAPISYPSQRPDAGATFDMKILVGGAGPHELRLSYVTEAPSWKPSYRVTVGKNGTIELQSWAIVDNTSGEDWQKVKLGVGASSAMSFRFDLQSLRLVQREVLQAQDLFVQAPPTGEAAYAANADAPNASRRPATAVATIEFDDDGIGDALASRDTREHEDAPKKAGGRRRVMQEAARPTAAPAQAPAPSPRSGAQLDQLARMASALQNNSNQVIVEGYAAPTDGDKSAASLARANKVRDQLIRNGIDAGRVVAVGKGESAGHAGGVRIVEAPAQEKTKETANGPAEAGPSKEPTEPIGTSHFESPAPMTVPKGTSAMVSILKNDTEGGVVYLYDDESARGNATYPFKAVRFRNPTDSALEQGPVTVFGEGRFIGEGMAEPIPARSVAFVPFALDRQIVVEKKDADREEIARILTVSRGVFSTEVKHTRKHELSLFNRLGERAVVYVKHSVAKGYTLGKAPPVAEKLGGAQLFRVEIEPHAKVDVTIEESTPTFKTMDIRSPAGLDMVKVYLSSAAIEGPLKERVTELLKQHAEMTRVEQQIATTREQMGEYRTRMDEIHAQLVTLRAVKTAGPIMAHLEKKLQEVSEKVSKLTVDTVGLEEKLMVARVRFQDTIADLSLDKKDGDETSKATANARP